MRQWFEQNHSSAEELCAGFYKKSTGEPSVTWPESVDVALCFGWIDGVRKNIDSARYQIRFTPRRAQSIWSTVNLNRVPELIRLGLMRPEGIAAFERRKAVKSGIYAYEQKKAPELTTDHLRKFRAHPAAWKFFEEQPPSYRRVVIWRVISARREETRFRRLDELIEACAEGRRLL